MAKNLYKKIRRTLSTYHFGKSLGGLKLIKELNALDNASIQSKVCKFYSQFCNYLNQLEKTDNFTKHYCSSLVHKEYTEMIINHWEWPGSIREPFKQVINDTYIKHTYWVIEDIHNEEKCPGKCDECAARPTVRYKTFGKTKSRYCDIHKFLIEKDKTNDNRNKN